MILSFQENRSYRCILSVFFLLCISLLGHAQEETPNAKQARRIFETAYDRVFGSEGSYLRYDVNIIGIFKTNGRIWLKGKKMRTSDRRVETWSDGQKYYKAIKKKKTVEIYNPNSDKKDKYASRFKFTLDDFRYSISKKSGGLLITLKQKKKAKGTIKEVKALLAPDTYAPIRLRIKVAFFWTTIKVSDFQAGKIDDSIFIFPRSKYTTEGWIFEDVD